MKRIKNVISLLLWFLGSNILIQFDAQAKNPISGNTGKIWYTDKYLYVNIVGNGVYEVDNSNPEKPVKVRFIDIPGNVDMAVMGNLMYANRFQDLIVIDLRDPSHAKEIFVIPNVFSHRRPANPISDPTFLRIFGLGNNSSGNSPTLFGGLLQRTILGNASQGLDGTGISGINGAYNSLNANMPAPTATTNRPTQGGTSKGGSMACFTIAGQYLYAIDSQDLHVFDLQNPQKPQAVGNKTRIGFDIETIFAYRGFLYIGSQTGMYIYDVRQNPTQPRRRGVYVHTRSCDPVVVEGNYAFVTMREGAECGGGENQLDVVDISNPDHPRRLKSYPMTNPYGLGIDNGLLFVCDGREGLKVFNAENVRQITNNMLAHFKDFNAYDVIPTPRKILIAVGGNRLKQYYYGDIKNLKLLSELTF
ncbi:MAG: hypothetical protein NZ551_12305 [Microscillaceae bacterium]|nr:hypothetical protein [Microscillaceae bacterium]MDW8461977.1 hypothetical protein [Cytophagales bacterium]